MIAPGIFKLAMAVAANNDRQVAVLAAAWLVLFQAKGIVFSADRASRGGGAKATVSALYARAAALFSFIHGRTYSRLTIS